MPSQTTDLVRSYLKEIGRYPLLTPEQEITNARLVQQMMAIEEQRSSLALQLNRQPTARELATSLGQSEAEVQSIIQQGQKAKEKMVTANLRLVVSVAKKYQNHNLDFLDLLQEGALGLQKGIEKFDPNRGYKLSTYVYWWIKQSITRAIGEKSRTIRLPIHINEKLNKIRIVQQQLSQSLGRPPVVAEIASFIYISRTRYSKDCKQVATTVKDASNCCCQECDRVPVHESVELPLLNPRRKTSLFQSNDA